ncbi:MAG: right-handed parallel beta-helix repeat-containing protein, partial [Promethearchaeota archaeon]
MKTIKKFWKYKWIKKHVKKLLISIILLLVFFSPFLGPLGSKWLLPKAATPHSPIYINGNTAMDAFFSGNTSDGLSWGSAYILDDLEFKVQAINEYTGIEIRNIDRYLIIKDCNFTDFSSTGIRFENVTNVNITGCFFDNCRSGIRTGDYCHHNIYQFNNFSSCEFGGSFIYEYNSTFSSNRIVASDDDGLSFVYAYNNSITENTIYNGAVDGLRIHECQDNEIIHNNISFNQNYGLYLVASQYNNISENSIQENNGHGVILSLSNNNTFRNNDLESDEFSLGGSYDNDIDGTNLVNGLPVSLIEGQTGIILNGLSNLGQLILVDCNFCTISNSELMSSAGLLLSESHNNTISNVNVTGSTYSGLRLSNSGDTEVVDCTIDNCVVGIYVAASDYVNITDNKVTNSGDNGIKIVASDFNRIQGNNVSINTNYGIYIQSSDNATVSNNFAYENQAAGFSVYNSENTTLLGNDAMYNLIGIRLDNAEYTDILYNNLSYNDPWGIRSSGTKYLRILWNNISHNEDNGVYLPNTDNITISNNIFSFNWDSGIFLQSAENCSITMNEIYNNTDSGIELYGYCNHNKIWNNTVYNNNPHSFYDHGAVKIRSDGANTTIWMNNFINNGDNGAVDHGLENVWDNGTHGNYWSNYIEKYPGATKIGNLWDTEYDTYGTAASSDRYPLVNPLVDGEIVHTAFFRANITEILTADYVQFLELATGGSIPYSFDWDFGDGSSHSTDANPDHQYNTVGEFEVILTVTDDDANVAIYSSNITVVLDLFPVASFSASDTLVLTYEAIYFTDTSTGGNLPLHYEWNFDDGSANSTSQNPDHDWESAGTYDVVLTINDTDGDMSIFSMEVTIEEELQPIASFTVNATTIMESEWIQFTFTGEEGNAPAIFDWSFGDGSYSDEENPIHQYTIAGYYTVQLVVEDRIYSMDMISMDITVNAPEPERKIPGYPIEWTISLTILIIG